MWIIFYSTKSAFWIKTHELQDIVINQTSGKNKQI